MRAELGAEALVLSTGLVPADRVARPDGCARGRDRRCDRASRVGERPAGQAGRPSGAVAAPDVASSPVSAPPGSTARVAEDVATHARRGVRGARQRGCATLAAGSRLAAADDRFAARGSVRRAARRRQDHHHREDRRAGARAAAAGGWRWSRPTASASAPSSSCGSMRTSSDAPFPGRAHASRPRAVLLAAAARYRCWSTRRADRRPTRPRASCSGCSPAARRAHAPRAARWQHRARRRSHSSTRYAAGARPTRLVLTKLDEAESLSPLVGVLRDRGLPDLLPRHRPARARKTSTARRRRISLAASCSENAAQPAGSAA